MNFHPTALKGREGRGELLLLIKTKQDLLERLKKLDGNKPDSWTEESIAALIHNVEHSKHLLSKKHFLPPMDSIDLAKRVFETLYREGDNKARVEALIAKILVDLSFSTKR